MAFTFRPAARANVGLLIGLSGSSGSGKTFTGMRLAKGIAGEKPFAVIDTEAGRANHYADQFRFDHGDLAPKFTPERYTEAIMAADKAGYPVILVDSASHEWAGEGGILDWQEDELQRLAKDDDKRRETMKMASWIKPKMAHKKMVQRLLQVRAHLILCFRAEQKTEMVKNADGRWEVVPKKSITGLDGWLPICEKNLPYELTASFLLMADRPGVPIPIKLQEQHKAMFPLDRPITERSGQEIAAWAHGASAPQTPLSQASADTWLKRIAAAATSADLDAINNEIKAAKALLSTPQLTALREAAREKSKALKKPPTKPATGVPVKQSDIQWGR